MDKGNKLYNFGPFRLDPTNRVLLKDGRELEESLRPKAFDVLHLLVRKHGTLLKKEDILNEVWQGLQIEESGLTKVVGEIRTALGDNSKKPVYIKTSTGQGYQFIAFVREEIGPRNSNQSLVGSVDEAATVGQYVDDKD